MAAGKVCPKYKELFATYMKQSKEVQRIYTEYADLFPHLSQMSGLNITTITDVYWLYNTIEIERDTNKTYVILIGYIILLCSCSNHIQSTINIII